MCNSAVGKAIRRWAGVAGIGGEAPVGTPVGR